MHAPIVLLLLTLIAAVSAVPIKLQYVHRYYPTDEDGNIYIPRSLVPGNTAPTSPQDIEQHDTASRRRSLIPENIKHAIDEVKQRILQNSNQQHDTASRRRSVPFDFEHIVDEIPQTNDQRDSQHESTGRRRRSIIPPHFGAQEERTVKLPTHIVTRLPTRLGPVLPIAETDSEEKRRALPDQELPVWPEVEGRPEIRVPVLPGRVARPMPRIPVPVDAVDSRE